ncbi:FKBP-type peptidyl-prolyl cis-trans isomerase [Filimonas lacunae]|uniref:Peptidyl-prolyl cis-trans isomerase n=1 Tax=Filimonas lacunae TaxID=477680 RepID=A0A173MKV3_9BACT|nr:FKBP-type peptidyl-prolyl cis-trans isomerase [Filimonas lacunae]BAV08099.1 FKBP-type peptidyl-prolyl cis-trans isomerase FkpA precursor [Filimonas lacunae]SIT09304.1 FKBP-type peptidyl-prolyl cis-trans isomerase [Filimonas lacunae]
MKQLLFVAAMAATFTACQVKYEKTKSGLLYKITKGKGGEKLGGGDFIKFNITYALPEKDTVLNTTYGKIPGYAMVDTSQRAKFTFMEVIPQCSVGDSIAFNLSIDTLKKLGAIPEYNNVFTKGGMIHGTVKILGRFKSEAETTEDYKKEMELAKTRDVKSVEDYLTKKGIKAQKTKSGAFVEITVPGDAALKADSGKQASIMYKGTLMSNDKVFDTNMDTSMHHTDPFKLVVGVGQVIKGWDEALPYFGKGGKGKIYVPSMLGYGPQGMGAIPPSSNLVFEVEVLDVTTPPPPAAGPAMPGMPPHGAVPGGAPHGAHH